MTDPGGSKSSARLASRLGAELRSAPGGRRAGLNLAAFLAVREEVAEALELGYTMKAVWEQLRKEDAVQMAYETFRDYCRSAELGRRPVTRGHPAAESPDGTPKPTFEHSSMPDEARPHYFLRVECVHCTDIGCLLGGRRPGGKSTL